MLEDKRHCPQRWTPLRDRIRQRGVAGGKSIEIVA
jgi:hypothetical protein